MSDQIRTVCAGNVYTLKESAEYLRCSYGTIHKWAKSGKLKTFRVGTDYRVRGEDILELTEIKS